MLKSGTETLGHVRELAVNIVAADGVVLAATWFLPAGSRPPPRVAVAIACGGGIAAKYYYRCARYLAARGAAVLCCDYRGIGASRHGSLRGFEAGIEHWGALDLGAALDHVKATYPNLPLAVVAHSVGTLLVGAAANAQQLSRIVFFGPHTGYWGDYGARWRWLLYLNWHVLMPMVTKMVGYFPGRALKMGEDLPREFALDWSGRRHPELVTNAKDHRRFDALLARFGEVRANALVLSVTDDAFAPPAAARRILDLYPNLQVQQEVVSPVERGVRGLGHMSFLKRSTGEFFWNRAAAWLLQEMPDLNGKSAAAP